MKFFLGIQFLLILLLVAGLPNNIRACSDASDADHVSKFHHEPSADRCTCCCVNETDSKNDCNHDEKDQNDCHCPGCGGHASGGHAGGLAADFQILFAAQPSDDLLKKQAFYFLKHLPEAVCLPIWQPPQLAA